MGVEEGAARQHRLGAVFEVQTEGGAFQDLDAGKSHLAAADQLDETRSLDLDHSDDRVLARLSVLDLQAGQRAVLAIDEADARTQLLLFVIGIVTEAVRADDEVLAVLGQQVAMVAAVDVVPLERDPARQRQMDVGLLAADQVAADAPHSGEMTVFRRPANDADVRAVGAVRRLNRVAGDGPLADGPSL